MPSMPADLPQLLTPAEWEGLARARQVDLRHHAHRDGQWTELPLTLRVDARALAVLAESAARGHRLHEFMRLERPGDVLRYWWVEAAAVDAQTVERVTARMAMLDRFRFRQRGSALALPFVVLDACFWNQAGRWIDPDADELARVWVAHRKGAPERQALESMLAVVTAAQRRLRARAEALQAHELALIDARRHARDFWAGRAPVDFGGSVPAARTRLDPGLFELIVSLARRDEVRSLSCGLDDPVLWHELVWVQVQRALRDGCAPRDALLLSGPDGGFEHFDANDRGGDVHMPCEGAREADVFVKPRWYVFDQDLARATGSVGEGLNGKAHKYALMEGYFGEFGADECVRCGGWTLYRLGVRRGSGDAPGD